MREARALTPTLIMGDTSQRRHTKATTARQALAIVDRGEIALVSTPGLALECLTALGMSVDEAAHRVQWAAGLSPEVGLDGLPLD